MSSSLHSLRAALMSDPAALSVLWAIPDRAAFAERAAEMGRGLGAAISPAELLAALAPRGPATPAMPVRAAGLTPAWLPSRLSITPQGGRLDWIYAGGEAFTAPFADSDFARLAAHPLNQLLPAISDPGELGSLPGPERPVDGLIFHISRCGSTLASRMLSAVGDILVLSEPQPVSAVLRAHALLRIDPAVQQAWLNGIVGAYRRAAGTRRLVIKLDAYSLNDQARLRQACPGTRAVVMHRDPLEVLVAQYGDPGIQAVAGMIEFPLPGRPLHEAIALPRGDYLARWLAALCEAGADAVAGGATAVGYETLPDALLDPAAPFLGLALSDADRIRMAGLVALNSKAPDRAFTPDSQTRRAAASGHLRTLAEDVVGPAYRRLSGQGAFA